MPLQMLLPGMAPGYFWITKMNCMPQQNSSLQNNASGNGNTPSLFNSDVMNNKIAMHKKNCRHRDENGWCNRSQRQCALLNIVSIKH